MNLTERLRAAEEERRRSKGLPPVIDLTDDGENAAATSAPHLASVPPLIDYDPVRTGDATSAFADPGSVVTDRRSLEPCPKCQGPTQIDMFDQVHQTVSMSCQSCFHMFTAPV